jgi:NAD(P)-dependent dehydrogenase (short-subunit alcohol dehydrogenase family)
VTAAGSPAPELLRDGVLDGVRAVVAAAPGVGAGLSEAVEEHCSNLGATVARCELAPSTEATDDDALARVVEDALGRAGGADLLVVDGAGLFAAAEQEQALLAGMQSCWDLTRAVAAAGMVEHGGGGLVVLVAPSPGAGAHAAAAAAGLENLARTLSIEWARFATRAVTIAPGDATAEGEIATLVAYLASPAGAYYSGCLLDLRGA